MATDVTLEEFNRLKTRVDVVEREVEGEKMVTRHILEQTRRNSDDLAVVISRLDRVETRLDRVEQKVDSLARNLPTVVGEVMREVLRERDAKG